MFLTDFVVSDHNAVLFKAPHLSPVLHPPHKSALVLSAHSLLQLSAFSSMRGALSNHPQLPLSVDELVSDFNNSCTTILDSIAPVRYKEKMK